MATKVLKGMHPGGESCVPQRGQEEGSKLTFLQSWDIFLPRGVGLLVPLPHPWVLLSAQDLAGCCIKGGDLSTPSRAAANLFADQNK